MTVQELTNILNQITNKETEIYIETTSGDIGKIYKITQVFNKNKNNLFIDVM